MKTSILSLLGLISLGSSPLFAEGGVFKAQVIGSQSELKIKGIEANGFGGSVSRNLNESDQKDQIDAVGGGAAFEMKLGDPLSVGAGLGYLQYEADSSRQAGYSDFRANVYGSLDLINQEIFALYALAGLSYHNLSLDDFRSNGVAVSPDPTGLINMDLGVGARFKLSYNSSFGLEYRYSNTFARNDVDLNLSGAGLTANGLKYKDVGIENNEALASLGLTF
jgi:opacity protein-like surface antigen